MVRFTVFCLISIIISSLLFLSGCCCCNPPISYVGSAEGLINEKEGYYNNTVNGKITNNTKYDLYDVTIHYSFYDSNLNKLEDKKLYKSFLAKKEIWIYTVKCNNNNAVQFECGSPYGYIKPQK